MSPEKLAEIKDFAFQRGVDQAFSSPVFRSLMNSCRSLSVALEETDATHFAEEQKEFRACLHEMHKALERLMLVKREDPELIPTIKKGDLPKGSVK